MSNHPLVEAAKEHVGDNLRSVATYQDRENEFLYNREDVERSYTEAERRAVFDELVLSAMERSHVETIFHAGRVECLVYCFEEAAVFHFATGDNSGLIISFDRDVEGDLDDFVSSLTALAE